MTVTAKDHFRRIMAERRRFPRGTPDHAYRSNAARKIIWMMRGKPVMEWAA